MKAINRKEQTILIPVGICLSEWQVSPVYLARELYNLGYKDVGIGGKEVMPKLDELTNKDLLLSIENLRNGIYCHQKRRKNKIVIVERCVKGLYEKPVYWGPMSEEQARLLKLFSKDCNTVNVTVYEV